MNKMQGISIAFIDLNLHMARKGRTDLYPFCEDTCMWPSVNGNVLTNQIDIPSEKTHEVTRCKQALKVSTNVFHWRVKRGIRQNEVPDRIWEVPDLDPACSGTKSCIKALFYSYRTALWDRCCLNFEITWPTVPEVFKKNLEERTRLRYVT